MKLTLETMPNALSEMAEKIDEIKNILSETQQTAPEPFIKGIHELAKFLQISPARAQKLKNENTFPYWQDGRTLLFDPRKIRDVMNNQRRA
jgi:hypothetical protein